ncbi:MAG: BNR-4 repeat-containing protein [Candidatus Krumholzibacteriota bacterium]|nr:BNR-4 repeat-containing protein [Candidatus Krumholzibacteriota bacterium]
MLPCWIDDKRITNGAWYACCELSDWEQYHGPAATFYTNTRPNAIRYTGLHDRTYFVYGDFGRDPAIQYYDHETKRLSPPVICGRTRIPDDAHGNPSILIDDDGYIYVFFGCHHHPIQMVRSEFPESIESWSPGPLISEEATYPEPYMLSPGRIILSFRQKTAQDRTASWVYTISEDRGENWTDAGQLIHETGKYIYAITETGSETPVRSFHIAFNPFDYGTNLYSNIYYIYSDNDLVTLKHRDGSIAAVPPCGLDACDLVYDSENNSSHVSDMILDDDNAPYILFNTGPWDKTGEPGDGEWRVARFDEEIWKSSRLAPCDHLFDRGCLALTDDGAILAYLPIADDGMDGGEIILYRSDNLGITWQESREITTGSEYSHNYAVRVRGADPEFRALWSYGSSEMTSCCWMDKPSELFLHGDGGFINAGLGQTIDISVKVEGVTSEGTLYMYCGNPGAASASDPGTCLINSYAAASQDPPDPELLLEWLIDPCADSVIDYSGNGNSGFGLFASVPGGSCPGRRYDMSMPGNVARFSPGGYIQPSEWNGPTTADSFSIEVWFRCESVDTIQPLACRWSGSQGFGLYIDNGTPNFSVGAGGINGGAFETAHVTGKIWHHIAAVYDGTNIDLYLDGQKSNTRYNQVGPVEIDPASLLLGSLDDVSFSGDIDEFRFYSRAMRGDEVRSHYMKKIFTSLEWTPGDIEPFNTWTETANLFITRVWPNPFCEQVNIEYHLDTSGRISIELFDAAGRRVRTLARDLFVSDGYQTAQWDGNSDTGQKAASGVYFLRISGKSGKAHAKIVIIR